VASTLTCLEHGGRNTHTTLQRGVQNNPLSVISPLLQTQNKDQKLHALLVSCFDIGLFISNKMVAADG
jgi:hypothetical protein